MINIFCLALTVAQASCPPQGSLQTPLCPSAASEEDDKQVFGGQSKEKMLDALGFVAAGSCHRSTKGVCATGYAVVDPWRCSAAASPVPWHGWVCSWAEQDWAGPGSLCSAWEELGVPAKPLWGQALALRPVPDPYWPFVLQRTCPLQRLYNCLMDEMRGSHMSRLSPGRIFSLWDFIASFHLKSLPAQGRAHNLGCPPAQGSQQHCWHGAAGTSDQTMMIMWGPLIWHPLDKMVNLKLMLGLGWSPYFQLLSLLLLGGGLPPDMGNAQK